MGFVRNRDVRQQEACIKELKQEVSRTCLAYEMIDEEQDPDAKEEAKYDLDKAKKDLAGARAVLKGMKKNACKFNALFRK